MGGAPTDGGSDERARRTDGGTPTKDRSETPSAGEREIARDLLGEVHEIVSKSPVVAFLWKNADAWPVEYVTENVGRIFGYGAEDFISGRVAFADVVHPDDLERVTEEVVRYSEEEGRGGFVHAPYRVVTKSGDVRWVRDQTSIRRGESGEITHYQGVLEDATQQVEAREALEKSERFLGDIIDSIQDGVSVLDRDLNVLLVNQSMQEWYADHAPLEGKKCYVCYQGREAPCDPCPSLRAMNSGRTEVDVVPGPAGSPVEWIELFGFPIRERESGRITGVVEFVRDITEKKRLERQLVQAQKMEAIGTLAGGLAHDFNNILMGIQGQASLMLFDVDESHPHHGHLKGIEESVKKASDLTSQLLGFARGGKYEIATTDMNRVIEDMSAMFARTKKEITIVRKLAEDLWSADVDRQQIENALLNLFINAWQAMPGGGELYVQSTNERLDESFVLPHGTAPGDYIKISVTDTGHGMDEYTRQRVFDPFFTTKDMGQGTGLGLASAYGIVRNHGGLINVYSELGEGTTFNIYLPASGAEVVVQPSRPADLQTGSETVLLVDDETDVLAVGESMLVRLGYEVITAKGGAEAVAVFEKQSERIDLVVLDMIMPDMGGSEAFDRLKEVDPGVRVLLSSGYSINGQAQDILERGCAGFIQKPFGLVEFSAKLREALGR